MRVYLVSTNHPKVLEFNVIDIDDKLFMQYAKDGGYNYSLKEFQNQLNSEIIPDFHYYYVRIIEVEVPEFTPEQEKQIELLKGFKAYLDKTDSKQVRVNNGAWSLRAKEFVKISWES